MNAELDRLAHDKVVEQPIRIRLDVLQVFHQLRRLRASARDRGEADVGGDGVQPRTQLRARLVAAGAFPRAQHRLLKRVVRVVQRPEHPVTVEVERSPVWLDQKRERPLVHRPSGRYSAGALGGSAPSSVHAPGAKAPGAPPIATNRIPSRPGRIWRS